MCGVLGVLHMLKYRCITYMADICVVHVFCTCTTITRTSKCLISLGRTHELCLCRDSSWVQGTSEIALHKNNECVLQPRPIKHELFLFIIPFQITQLGIVIHNDITMAIHYNIIMCNDVVRDAHCEITMGGEHIHYFCVRLFHLSFGLM